MYRRLSRFSQFLSLGLMQNGQLHKIEIYYTGSSWLILTIGTKALTYRVCQKKNSSLAHDKLSAIRTDRLMSSNR